MIISTIHIIIIITYALSQVATLLRSLIIPTKFYYNNYIIMYNAIFTIYIIRELSTKEQVSTVLKRTLCYSQSGSTACGKYTNGKAL